MRKLLLILLFLVLPVLGFTQTVPNYEGWVNDFAKIIDAPTKEKLTSLIQEVESKTTAEIAVVTISSIAPYDEIAYARVILDNWKIGKKGKDNGVLVLLAVKERRWRIETGYGVEGILPDGVCGDVGRNYMVPFFKQGNYAQGLYQGVSVIASIIAKDAKVKIEAVGNLEKKDKSEQSQILAFLIIVVILVFFNLLFYKHKGYFDDSWTSGGFGSYGGRGGGFGGGCGGGGGFGGFGGGRGGGGGAGGGF